MVELLLVNGTNVNATHNVRATPLLDAVLNGRTKIPELLLDKGADVNERDEDGDTLLDCATTAIAPITITFLRKNDGKNGL